LTLLAKVAELQPLALIIDDAQWLDQASERVLAFVARRLVAERIAVIGAARTGIGDHFLAGLPGLAISGLADRDARALLLTNLPGPLDADVCGQIVAESHGNPLALLELPRSRDLAGGFALPGVQPVADKIEERYGHRLDMLPSDTRLLVLAAAAEPCGDPALLHLALGRLEIEMTALDAAVAADLISIGTRVEFTHPLVRSTVYRMATAEDRRRVHRALADATNPETDPDRRAWHRARATLGPDEDVAAELERSVDRAQARGGVAAAAAFLERAAAVSPEPRRRAGRALQAAHAKELAGDVHSASMLLAAALHGPLDERESALAQRLEGQIALDEMHVGEAVPSLVAAAGRLEVIEPAVARHTYLEAMRAGQIAGRFGGEMLRRAAHAARGVVRQKDAPDAGDLLLAGMAIRFTEGYVAGAVSLKQALHALRGADVRVEHNVRWLGFAGAVALDVFDDEASHELATRSVELARERGALGALPLALDYLAIVRGFEGDLDGAATALEEADIIADTTGAARIGTAPLTLAGFRGDERPLFELLERVETEASTGGAGTLLTFGEHALALLSNGLGQYEAALPAADSASGRRDEMTVSTWSLPEVVEAAARCGRSVAAADALDRLVERTQVASTDAALGVEARSRALLSEGAAADDLYRSAIDHLGRARLLPELARAHLLYGEWLRRGGRRTDARRQLHAAHEMFVAIGMSAFAERGRRELIATGERMRKRTDDTGGELSMQEEQIARLARSGLSDREIGAQLFLSSRTVEWHLRHVYMKLGISSRRELRTALRDDVLVRTR
jgi:DNA-binding CsgD family transcriptional regulator